MRLFSSLLRMTGLLLSHEKKAQSQRWVSTGQYWSTAARTPHTDTILAFVCFNSLLFLQIHYIYI